MASGGNDQDVKYILSKLLQMGTVAEYQREAFSLARIAEARYEDERSTIAIAKPNDLIATNDISARNSLQRRNIYEGCCQLDIQFSNLEELQPNQDEKIFYYYWKICFSILNVDEADNTKPSLFADTFGNNRGDDSETSGPRVRLQAMVMGRPYQGVRGSPEEASWEWISDSHTPREADVGRRKRVKCYVQGSGRWKRKKGVDRGSGRRDYALFAASVFALLNPGPGSFAHRRIWDP
ncbi:hypothetical protein Tco_0390162 [Tanacetum coccineum]